LASKFSKKAEKEKKISKNAEFQSDFESVEKVVTKCTKNKFDEHE
jgi:hypothetical protein